MVITMLACLKHFQGLMLCNKYLDNNQLCNGSQTHVDVVWHLAITKINRTDDQSNLPHLFQISQWITNHIRFRHCTRHFQSNQRISDAVPSFMNRAHKQRLCRDLVPTSYKI